MANYAIKIPHRNPYLLAVLFLLLSFGAMGFIGPSKVAADSGVQGACALTTVVGTQADSSSAPEYNYCSSVLSSRVGNYSTAKAIIKKSPKSCFTIIYQVKTNSYNAPQPVSCSGFNCSARNATGTFPKCSGTVYCDSAHTVEAPGGNKNKCHQCRDGHTPTNNDVSNCPNGAQSENGLNAGGLPQIPANPQTINKLLDILFGIIGAIAILVVTIGGMRYVFANGDPSQIARAKNTILYAMIGLVVAISGYSIVTFVIQNL